MLLPAFTIALSMRKGRLNAGFCCIMPLSSYVKGFLFLHEEKKQARGAIPGFHEISRFRQLKIGLVDQELSLMTENYIL